MLNLQICTVIIMKKKHKKKNKIIKKIHAIFLDSNPGYMGSKSTKIFHYAMLCIMLHWKT